MPRKDERKARREILSLQRGSKIRALLGDHQRWALKIRERPKQEARETIYLHAVVQALDVALRDRFISYEPVYSSAPPLPQNFWIGTP